MTEWSQTVLQYIVETHTISEEDSDPISNGGNNEDSSSRQTSFMDRTRGGITPGRLSCGLKKSKTERSQPYTAMKSNHREN